MCGRDARPAHDQQLLCRCLQVSLQSAQLSEHQAQLARVERRLALLTKERDGLKLILASYDQEEARIVSLGRAAAAAGGDAAAPSPFGAQLGLRVRELESLVEEQRQTILLLEQDARKATGDLAEARWDGLDAPAAALSLS